MDPPLLLPRWLLLWHVETGMVMSFISIFHLGWHLKYYVAIFARQGRTRRAVAAQPERLDRRSAQPWAEPGQLVPARVEEPEPESAGAASRPAPPATAAPPIQGGAGTTPEPAGRPLRACPVPRTGEWRPGRSKLLGRDQLGERALVHADDHVVLSADDEERGGLHQRQGFHDQVGPARPATPRAPPLRAGPRSARRPPSAAAAPVLAPK